VQRRRHSNPCPLPSWTWRSTRRPAFGITDEFKDLSALLIREGHRKLQAFQSNQHRPHMRLKTDHASFRRMKQAAEGLEAATAPRGTRGPEVRTNRLRLSVQIRCQRAPSRSANML
jgi:hypothetical protein